MPELPEVETTRRGLARVMVGQVMDGVTVHRRDLRVPLPHDFTARLNGNRVKALRRRAKYLLADLESNEVLLMHLGMSGSLRTVHPQNYQPRTHDHVLFAMGKHLVVFHDPRRFGFMQLFKQSQEAQNPWLKHLGVEPLSNDFRAAYLEHALARRKAPIKPALMDQRLVVGVGNIYASESLFLAGIDPRAPAHRVAPHSKAIVRAIKTTLNAAIRSGGSTLRDYVGADGADGYFQHRFNVYAREGEECFVCAKPIVHLVQAGRATYHCSQCQHTR